MPEQTTPFSKGHGTENDFILLPDFDADIDLDPALVRVLCDRRAGLGADGVIRIARTEALIDKVIIAREAVGESSDGEPEDTPEWFMDYRNADGSIAEMCGNGSRVFGHYLFAHHLVSDSPKFSIGTRAGVKRLTVVNPSQATDSSARIAVDMGRVGIIGQSVAAFDRQRFAGVGIDVGNPHLACVIPDLDDAGLRERPLHLKPVLDEEFFPHGANVEVLTPLRADESRDGDGMVSMRVHERGSGETRSCGTGTVAAAVAALADRGQVDGTVRVGVPGGEVTVTIKDEQATLEGPSVIVASGTINIDQLREYASAHYAPALRGKDDL